MTRVNSHIHLPPNFSAFDSVAHAVALAQEQGVGVLGVSNYYDYAVYDDFARRAADAGVFPLYGLEIIALDDDLRAAGVKVNDPGNPGRVYLCGKAIGGFSPVNERAAPLLETIRTTDTLRMARMVDKMAERFADAGLETGLDADAVIAGVVARHGSPVETVFLQERHVAQAFQAWLFEHVAPADRPAALERLFGAPSAAGDDPGALQNALRSNLMKAGKAAYVEETFVGFDHARRLILALGGVPVYPTLIDGASPICPFEADPATLIARLNELGIHAAEFIPVRNTPEVLGRYVAAMRAAGMIVTAGTEHNTPELIPMEPTCKGVPIPDDLKAVFWEGACVLAAHQSRVANGLPGYVDGAGRRTDLSVATLAAEGEALIAAR